MVRREDGLGSNEAYVIEETGTWSFSLYQEKTHCFDVQCKQCQPTNLAVFDSPPSVIFAAGYFISQSF